VQARAREVNIYLLTKVLRLYSIISRRSNALSKDNALRYNLELKRKKRKKANATRI